MEKDVWEYAPIWWDYCPNCDSLFLKQEFLFGTDGFPEKLSFAKYACGSVFKYHNGFRKSKKCKKGIIIDPVRFLKYQGPTWKFS